MCFIPHGLSVSQSQGYIILNMSNEKVIKLIFVYSITNALFQVPFYNFFFRFTEKKCYKVSQSFLIHWKHQVKKTHNKLS